MKMHARGNNIEMDGTNSTIELFAPIEKFNTNITSGNVSLTAHSTSTEFIFDATGADIYISLSDQELLLKNENIKISRCSIATILRKQHILSPKAHRSTKRALKKELESLQMTTKSKKGAKKIQSSLLDFCEAHCRKSRSCYFGELLQMDASIHQWFANQICHLHVAIDDATGAILGAFFDEQEALKGYYNVLHQILTNYAHSLSVSHR